MSNPTFADSALLLHRHYHITGFSPLREEAIPEDISSLGLPTNFQDKIYINNRYGDLCMFQSLDSKIPKYGASVEEIKEFDEICKVRGWVINIRTRQLVANSMTEDKILFGTSDLLDSAAASGIKFFPFVEGTPIRFCYTGTEWVNLTARRIDASTSNLPETNIKCLDILRECCPEFNEDILDTNYVYHFLIIHPQNQIMNPEPVEKCVIFVGNTKGPDVHESDPNVLKLQGIRIMAEISSEQAKTLVDAQKWILMRDLSSTSITRYGLPGMQQLCTVRRINESPFHPPPYLYLNITEEERPILQYAVSDFVRPFVTVDYMQNWINEQALLLRDFCVKTHLARSESFFFRIPIDLDKFVKSIGSFFGNRRDCEIYFQKEIIAIIRDNGLLFYKLTKQVQKFMSRLDKVKIIDVAGPEGNFFARSETHRIIPSLDFQDDFPKPDFKKSKKKKTPQQKKNKSPPNIKKQHREAKLAQPRPRNPNTRTMAEMLAGMVVDDNPQ